MEDISQPDNSFVQDSLQAVCRERELSKLGHERLLPEASGQFQLCRLRQMDAWAVQRRLHWV